ncbi:MAG: hypothetical protein WC273_07515 [Dehalococcoidia bacterium]
MESQRIGPFFDVSEPLSHGASVPMLTRRRLALIRLRLVDGIRRQAEQAKPATDGSSRAG